MSKVQEIQNAITDLPEQERLSLFNWIHAQEEADLGKADFPGKSGGDHGMGRPRLAPASGKVR